MEDKIKIYSYGKVWKVEKKIYSIANLVLPAPISPNNAVSFIGVFVALNLLIQMVPPLQHISAVLRYFLLPYCISQYLMKKKLDGKNPIMYVAGLVRYVLTGYGTYIEGFTRYRDDTKTITEKWRCSRGRYIANELSN